MATKPQPRDDDREPEVRPLPIVGRLDAAPPVRPTPSRRRVRWGWIAVLIVALGATSAGGFAYWQSRAVAQPQYLTVPIKRGNIEDVITAAGTLQPQEFVDVGTQVSGQLRRLHVEVGATVQEGDLLAELDPTVYDARVEAGRATLLNLNAQLADRQAQLVLARQQAERQERLRSANATSEDAYESARAALASASAQVDAIRAQIQNTESTLKADQANLGYTKIRAPMAGTVVSQTAKQGQTLNANQQAPIVLRIANLATMTVSSQVSEADIGRLAIDMPAYFTTLGQPDRRWEGRLRKIMPTPEVVNNVVLYGALFDVPNASGDLLPQMTVQTFFVTAAAKNVLLVPASAVQRPDRQRPGNGGAVAPAASDRRPAEGAGPRVLVVGPDGKAIERPVSLGIVTRAFAEVRDGLNEGEQVVIGVKDGRSGQDIPGFARTPRLS